MPATSPDVLAYTRDLESVGLPRLQAEAIAKGMINMLAEQSDTMVTREHFDAVMARMDLRFDQIDLRFDQIDQRFEQVDQRFEQVDQRFEQVDQRFKIAEKRLDILEDRSAGLVSLKSQVNLHTWMLGLIILVLVVPQLQQWFGVT